MLCWRKQPVVQLILQVPLFSFVIQSSPLSGVVTTPLGEALSSSFATNSSKPANATTLLLSSDHDNVSLFTYEVTGTNMEIDFVIWNQRPIEREALARGLLNGKLRVWQRLRDEGNDWLTADDDPFLITIPDKCYIRIDSRKAPNGRRFMTYQTLLSVFDGLWDVLYLRKDEREASIRFEVSGIVAGHGATSVTEIKPSTGVQNNDEAFAIM